MSTLSLNTQIAFHSEITVKEGLYDEVLKDRASSLWFYDEALPDLWIKKLVAHVPKERCFALPAKEKAKTFETFQTLVTLCDALKPTRHTTVVALGGGALCDTVAFFASTYLRGLPLVLVPTTLLAMVDASIGGKTALNTSYKNRIGTFYPASKVCVDPNFLTTLTPQLKAEGYSEIIKIAAVFDRDFFAGLEAKTLSETNIIERAIHLKCVCVEKDLSDQGQRMLLNFGHTYGHALESLHQYQIPHGICVAAGMVLMTQNQPHVGQRIKTVLKQYDAYQPIPFERDALIEALYGDKKRSNQSLTVVRLHTLGHGTLESLPIETFILEIPQHFKEDAL